MSSASIVAAITPPKQSFPLIRHLSWRVTRILVRFPVTPNQITIAGIVFGLAGAWLLSLGEYAAGMAGAFGLFLTYLCCHCDGEVARAKRLESKLGDTLSELCGFLVNTALMLALGEHAYQVFGNEVWRWLGYVAAFGATLNYLVNTFLQGNRSEHESNLGDLAHSVGPDDLEGETRLRDKLIYFLRELAEADYCFVLLALAALNVPWVLLPPAVIGAQVFWITGLFENARKFRA